jgi:ankyrin repeat protein
MEHMACTHDVLKVRARLARHIHESIFDFFVANHMWDLNDHFFCAAQNSQLDTIKYLYSIGANIHALEDCALRSAADAGNLECVKYLVSVGANVHAKHNDALQNAAYRGHLDCVKYLISVGADVWNYGEETIQWAVNKGHTHVIRYLISVNNNLSSYSTYCTFDDPFEGARND